MVELRAAARAARERREREVAEAALADQREEDARRAEMLRSALRVVLGDELAAAIAVDGRRVVVDGLTLEAPGWRDLAVIGRCPDCGAEVPSGDVTSLASLGRLAEAFEPTYLHAYDCAARRPPAPAPAEAATPEPSLGDRLVALLREIAAAEAGG